MRCPLSFRTVLEATYFYRERHQNLCDFAGTEIVRVDSTLCGIAFVDARRREVIGCIAQFLSLPLLLT